MSEPLALSTPWINGNAWKYVKECLDTSWVSTAGKFVNQFEEAICRVMNVKYAVAVASGTTALQIALEVAGVQRDEEVIVPTVTFIAPVNAVKYVGADPIFMDCDDYYSIDAVKTIEFLENQTMMMNGKCFNKKTKRRISAIIPVHVFGNAVNLPVLINVCKKRNIQVIEDATESLGTTYRLGAYQGKHAGTIGDVGCLSFNGNKIITAGGGGMIISNDEEYASLAKYLTTQAKDDAVYYIHNRIGYNFRLNNMQAALGVAQLEHLDEVIERKNKNYRTYKNNINDIEGLHLADVPDYANNNHWMYALQIDQKKYGFDRDELIKLFSKKNIEVRPLWHLNHLQKPYEKNQVYKVEKAYQLLEKTLNIPCSSNISKSDIVKVVGLLKKWKK